MFLFKNRRVNVEYKLAQRGSGDVESCITEN